MKQFFSGQGPWKSSNGRRVGNEMNRIEAMRAALMLQIISFERISMNFNVKLNFQVKTKHSADFSLVLKEFPR